MLDEDLTVTEALDQAETRQFTRMPVYGEDIDDIKGKVIRADLFEAERSGHGSEPIKQFAKKVIRVSEEIAGPAVARYVYQKPRAPVPG